MVAVKKTQVGAILIDYITFVYILIYISIKTVSFHNSTFSLDGEMAGRYGGKLSLELSKALEQWIKKNNGTHPLKNWIPFNPNH